VYLVLDSLISCLLEFKSLQQRPELKVTFSALMWTLLCFSEHAATLWLSPKRKGRSEGNYKAMFRKMLMQSRSVHKICQSDSKFLMIILVLILSS